MLRFPLVLSYCFLGVCLGAYAAVEPGFLAELPLTDAGRTNYNLAVPVFVLNHFPHGLIGLTMVGLVAAAMSSLDSTLNALSALTMEDIVKGMAKTKGKKPFSARTELIISKLLTVFWGAVCLAFSFFVGDVSQTVIESINKIGSLINGPLLAVFLMGILSRRVNGQGAVIGLIAGFCGNLWLWKFAPAISWLWWNVIGFLVTYAGGYAASGASSDQDADQIARFMIARQESAQKTNHRRWWAYYMILAAYGMSILILLTIVTELFN